MDAEGFWNPDMNISKDLLLITQTCCLWAICFVVANKLLMTPIATMLIKDRPENNSSKGQETGSSSKSGLRQRKKIRVEGQGGRNGKPEPAPEQVTKQRHKFVASMWKFLSYTAFVVYGVCVANTESSWFWVPDKYHLVFPKGQIPHSLYWYYLIETSYYIFSLGLLAWEPKMKDRTQMCVHHLITLTLLITSYAGRMIKFGIPIMLLHDAADPLMELAKMLLYCGKEVAANFFLAAFTVTFMYLRNWVFPGHIIWSIYRNKQTHLYPYYKVTLGCLCALATLHIYWAALILKIGYSSFVVGKATGDIREED